MLLNCAGREARTYGLGLDQAKVEVDNTSGKINVDSSDVTSAGHIFAIGDAVNVSWSIYTQHMQVVMNITGLGAIVFVLAYLGLISAVVHSSSFTSCRADGS